MSMSDRDGFIWQDGKLVPWRDATTHVLTHSLHYGMGVFEGVRAYKTERGTAIFRLKEHTERLFRSAHIFQMQMPYSAEELNDLPARAGGALRPGAGGPCDLSAYHTPNYRAIVQQAGPAVVNIEASIGGGDRRQPLRRAPGDPAAGCTRPRQRRLDHGAATCAAAPSSPLPCCCQR